MLVPNIRMDHLALQVTLTGMLWVLASFGLIGYHSHWFTNASTVSPIVYFMR